MLRDQKTKLANTAATDALLSRCGSINRDLHAITDTWQRSLEECISRCQPVLNCALFFVGLYVIAQRPPRYLSWLGIPGRLLLTSESWQSCVVKLTFYIGSCTLVLAALDGRGSRRIFSALLFPLLVPFGAIVDAVAARASSAVPWSAVSGELAMVTRGAVFGIIAALLIVVPLTFLYRRRVIAIAGLVLIPVVARDAAKALYGGAYQSVLLQLSCYVSFLVCVEALSGLLRRHLMPGAELAHERKKANRS